MNFEILGWSEALPAAAAFEALSAENPSLLPARVIRQDSHLLRVATPVGVRLARLAGRLRQSSVDPTELPVVGDWLAVAIPPGASAEDHAVIEAVLPRRSLLSRRADDEGHHGQPLAANVDFILLVMPMDRLRNLRWVQRAMTLAYDSGAAPIVVLTKADLGDAEAVREELHGELPDAAVVPVSGFTGGGVEALLERLPAGSMAVMLGPSGAGKSTLLNRLLGREEAVTAAVRATDGRGRHTTSHREIHLLPTGALLIDAPGVRELGLWDAEDGLDLVFPEVVALASGCRFRDCVHESEPGCAVRDAVEAGALAPEVLDDYSSLRREQQWLEEKATLLGRRRLKQREKTRSQAGRKFSREKRKPR